ncbi:MAG: outer membrane beta-barrel protein [Mariprofundus sp.]|nr:outer membrane beta-barrel protein [Mariprofundus sp.]
MKKLLLSLTALLCMQASIASATEIKPYAGVGLGVYELDPGANKKATFGGYGFFGADLHEYFAAEFRAGLTGKKGREELGPLTETFKVDWFLSLFAKPKIAISSDFELYALLGVTSIKTSFTPLASVVQASSTKTGFSYGLGASYQIMDQLKLGAEWVRYSSNADAATKNTAAFKGLDVNGFTATLAYQF